MTEDHAGDFKERVGTAGLLDLLDQGLDRCRIRPEGRPNLGQGLTVARILVPTVIAAPGTGPAPSATATTTAEARAPALTAIATATGAAGATRAATSGAITTGTAEVATTRAGAPVTVARTTPIAVIIRPVEI